MSSLLMYEKAYIKSLKQICNENDYDTKMSKWRSNKSVYTFWSKSRRKYIDVNGSFVENYFGSPTLFYIKCRDEKNGIYTFWISEEPINIHNKYHVGYQLMYDWMLTTLPHEFFTDDDFLV